VFFVAVRRTAQLSLTTPLDFCCNCGSKASIDLVETPLRQTRYFFVAGTELTLLETFPYCKRCRTSAQRVRLGGFSKLLVACLVCTAAFLALVLLASHLPARLSDNLFTSSVAIGIAGSLAYFWIRERASGRSYYQPVSLVDAAFDSDSLSRFTLRFFNRRYAQVFSKANADAIRAGLLRVVLARSQ
jgi:hypothetical protein